MLYEWQMVRWAALTLGLVGGTALGTLATTRVTVTGVERVRAPASRGDASLARQVAAVDAAIVAGDRSRAIYAWRDAYGLALRSGDWQSLVAVGDAAIRIDELEEEGMAFRAEARQAYLLRCSAPAMPARRRALSAWRTPSPPWATARWPRGPARCASGSPLSA